MNRRSLLTLPLALAALAAGPGSALATEDRRLGGGDSYIQIETVTGTVLRGGQRRGVMTVQLGIDVPDPGLRTRAAASAPRLRAAYAQVVMTYAAGLPPGGLPNADYLSRELQRQTDLVLGRPGARLLLGSIVVN
jgi:hypothetical protein